MARTTALTGTPGTGKSSVARALSPEFQCVELAQLADRLSAARRTRRGRLVDLPRLRSRFRDLPARSRPDLLVGHLAHLLPLRDAIVLRCHPVELDRRLARARRSVRARRENFEAEALDLVLVEALQLRRRVWEVDTTHRSIAQVASIVRHIVRGAAKPAHGTINWLSDPRVTDQLLPRGR